MPAVNEADPVVPHQRVTGKVTRGAWDDPADTGRKGSYSMTVYGWRRGDALMDMHLSSPSVYTIRHIHAAARLRDDYDISEGVSTGKGSGGDIGPTEAMLDAAQRVRNAAQHLGPDGWEIIRNIVIRGWTIPVHAEKSSTVMSLERLRGYLVAQLTALDNHYHPVVVNHKAWD